MGNRTIRTGSVFALLLVVAVGLVLLLTARDPPGNAPEPRSPSAEGRNASEAQSDPEEDLPTAFRHMAGTVVDESGRPLEGVHVEFRCRVPGQTENVLFDECITESDGRFRLRQPRSQNPGEILDLCASRDDYPTATLTLQSACAGLRIVLRTAETLEVTVVDVSSGDRLSGVSVRAHLSESASYIMWDSRATTGEVGTARLTLPAGKVAVSASLLDRPIARTEVVVRKGEPARLRIALTKGSTLRGVVVETGTGRPLPGIRVQGMGQSAQAKTDADGRFEICGLGPPVFLRLEGDWHVGRHVPLMGFADGTTLERRLELEPGGRVSGLVLDADGRPVAGAIVGTKLDSFNGRPTEGVRTTDDRGAFRTGGVAPGESVVVHATKEGLARGRSESLDVAAGEEVTGVVIRLDPRRSLILVPRVGDGTPLPPFCNAVVFHAKGGERTHERIGRLSAGGMEWIRDGEILLWALPSTESQVVVRAGEYVAMLRSQELPVLGTNELPRVPVVLERGLTIDGRLVDGEGRPVEGASLIATHGEVSGLLASTTTDAGGRFVFAGLLPGEYELSVSRHGRSTGDSPETRRVRAGSTDVLLRPEGTLVAGEVLDPEGHPAEATVVAWWSERGGPPPHEVQRKGSFSRLARGEFQLDLPPGVWWIAACSRTWAAPAPLEVSVRPGANRVTPIRLCKAVSVTGSVRGTNGPLAAGAVLAWPARYTPRHLSLRFPDRLMVVARSNSRGTFTLGPLGPGRWTVFAGAKGHGFTGHEITIDAAEAPPELNLDLRPGAYVEVEIRGPDGATLPGGIWVEDGAAAAIPGPARHQLTEELEHPGRPERVMVPLTRSGPHEPGAYPVRVWARLVSTRGKAILRKEIEVELGEGDVRTVPVTFDQRDVEAAYWVQGEHAAVTEITNRFTRWNAAGDAANLEEARRLLAELRSRAPEGHWERVLVLKPVLRKVGGTR